MLRRAADISATVTLPAPRSRSSTPSSGAACGNAKDAARPGVASQAASPDNHSETDAPALAAAAAIVNPALQRSAASSPTVTSTTKDRRDVEGAIASL